MKTKVYFHGDVGLIQQKELPKGIHKITGKKIVLREGELTGHAHTIEESDKVDVYRDNNDLWLDVKEEIGINHQQHNFEFTNLKTGDKEKIKPGIYRIPNDEPREYDFFEEEAKRVAD